MKHFRIFAALLLTISPFSGIRATDAVEIDGIFYNINATRDTAEVTVNPNQYSDKIVIPPVVNYEGSLCVVASIGDRAFYNNTNLTSVEIGENIQTIKSYAFYHTGISSIVIPEGVIAIQHHAFMSNSKLTSLTLPTSLATIGTQAFAYCTELTSVTIPKYVCGKHRLLWL